MSDVDCRIARVPKVYPGCELDLIGPFRETFLAEFFDVGENQALRMFGKLQLGLVYDSFKRGLPSRNVDWTPHFMQAVLADLRHLQEYLMDLTGDDGAEAKEPFEGHKELLRRGQEVAQKLALVADDLEQSVGDWDVE